MMAWMSFCLLVRASFSKCFCDLFNNSLVLMFSAFFALSILSLQDAFLVIWRFVKKKNGQRQFELSKNLNGFVEFISSKQFLAGTIQIVEEFVECFDLFF